MNKIITLILVLCVAEEVLSEENVATITDYKNENLGNGEYTFSLKQSDGIEREESGKFEGSDNYVVRGYYSYIDPTGRKYIVDYYADRTGYHPMIIPVLTTKGKTRIGTQSAIVASLLG